MSAMKLKAKTVALIISLILVFCVMIYYVEREIFFNTGISIFNPGISLFNRQGDMSDVVMKAAIQQYATQEVYYFLLKHDGTLTCKMGRLSDPWITRMNFNTNSFTRNFMHSISESGEKQLTEQEFQNLINIAASLINVDRDSAEHEVRFSIGGSRVYVFFNDVFYVALTSSDQSEVFLNLADEIIRLSPIEVRFPGR